MAEKQKSNVDNWLERETDHVRTALENASRYFDNNDVLTVNTLEAVYGQESSFGTKIKTCGITGPAGHFQIEKATAERYGLSVTKKNDQRFDIDDAAYAAANYLKDLDGMFSKPTVLSVKLKTRPVVNKAERKLFVLAAYNAGEGNIYIQKVSNYEIEFAEKSPADKSAKQKKPRKTPYRCIDGRWRTIDDKPVMICD